MPPDDGGTFGCYLLFFLFSHCWFAMPQLVLQADWQDVWHSPQPPFLALSQRSRVSMVLMCFMMNVLPCDYLIKIYHTVVHLSIIDTQFCGKTAFEKAEAATSRCSAGLRLRLSMLWGGPSGIRPSAASGSHECISGWRRYPHAPAFPEWNAGQRHFPANVPRSCAAAYGASRPC